MEEQRLESTEGYLRKLVFGDLSVWYPGQLDVITDYSLLRVAVPYLSVPLQQQPRWNATNFDVRNGNSVVPPK